nr:MAG TPA: Histone-lysine N-methyltransferase [Caudoviricetes sp.]
MSQRHNSRCYRHRGWKSIRCRMEQYPCLDYRYW